MKNTNLKIAIGITAAVFIGLFLIGMYVSSDIMDVSMQLLLFLGAVVAVLPFLISYRKTGRIFKPVPIAATGILFVAFCILQPFELETFFYYLLVTLWPFVCYGASRFITDTLKTKQIIWLGILLYDIILVAFIYLMEERLYVFCFGRIIHEMYWYLVAQIALFASIRRQGFGKKEIITFSICNVAILAVWLCTQERVVDIFRRMTLSFSDVDLQGEYRNWFAQRKNLLESSISGNYSNLNWWQRDTIMYKCMLTEFRAAGYGWLAALIAGLSLLLSGLLIKLAMQNKHNNWLKVLIAALVLRNTIGLLVNIFLFYSSNIGFMFIRNFFDMIPLVWILFALPNTTEQIEISFYERGSSR